MPTDDHRDPDSPDDSPGDSSHGSTVTADDDERSDERPPEAGSAESSTPAEVLLSRSQVARRLGVSVSTVRRMEGLDLHPIVVDGKHLFPKDDVEQIAKHSAGNLAAVVFQALEDDKPPWQIVIDMKIAPERVEALFKTYCRLKQAVVVQAPTPQSTKIWLRAFGVDKLDGKRIARALQIVASRPELRRVWLQG